MASVRSLSDIRWRRNFSHAIRKIVTVHILIFFVCVCDLLFHKVSIEPFLALVDIYLLGQ